MKSRGDMPSTARKARCSWTGEAPATVASFRLLHGPSGRVETAWQALATTCSRRCGVSVMAAKVRQRTGGRYPDYDREVNLVKAEGRRQKAEVRSELAPADIIGKLANEARSALLPFAFCLLP